MPNATPLQNAQSQRIFRLDEIERASYKNLEIKDYYRMKVLHNCYIYNIKDICVHQMKITLYFIR